MLAELARGQQAAVDERADPISAGSVLVGVEPHRTLSWPTGSGSADGGAAGTLGLGSTLGLAAGADGDALGSTPGLGDGGLHCGSGGLIHCPSAETRSAYRGEEVVRELGVERVHVQDAVPDEGRELGRHLLEPRDDRAEDARRDLADRARWEAGAEVAEGLERGVVAGALVARVQEDEAAVLQVVDPAGG